jgi:hypothetical protein
MTPRAQSESVGVILLTAVVVIVVSAAGVFVLADADGDETTRVDLSIEVTEAGVAVAHNGGNSVPLDDLRVVVRNGSETWRPDVNESGIVGNSTDEQFDRGDRWVWRESLATDEITTVQVFDLRTNTLLSEVRRYPTSETPLTST